MFVFPNFQITGKYEREALIRERDDLWSRRHRLSAAEGARLDTLLGSVGHPEGYDSRQNASAADLLRQIQGEQA